MIKKAEVVYLYFGTGFPIPKIKIPPLEKGEIFALPAEPRKWRVFRTERRIEAHLISEPGEIQSATRIKCPWIESGLYGPLGIS